MNALPEHLKKYIVEQNYERYTPLDQAVWRYVLRQLKKFLGKHAHAAYLEGLQKTGIDIEQIPKIEEISAKLEKFGWCAKPVSGFIPPAAFMELQSLSILPIASDMRSIDHLLYTPAPDIVHEAAGHAPILAHKEYADYLKQYAQVAQKAIMSKQDLEQYEAIRELSDLKENPKSTTQQIQKAEENLNAISKKMDFVSEAAELSRMNWWTAEYGLIGNLNSAKIFGAGLLSSVGESKWCLSEKVKKIPLTVDCVKQGYNITEPQPQLFVTESFHQLSEVLQQFSKTMAYQIGGTKALDKLLQAQTVNTVQFENHLQISGVLKSYKKADDQSIAYLQFQGPTQICHLSSALKGHGLDYHKEGYGTPVGEILNFDLQQLVLHEKQTLNYKSGLKVTGLLADIQRIAESAVILKFKKAECVYQNEILFRPDWGDYDIILANDVISVFGGPADRKAYGLIDDFVAARVQIPTYSETQKKVFSFYQAVRDFRLSPKATEVEFNELFLKISQQAADEWLLFVELAEISYLRRLNPDFLKLILFHLEKLSEKNESWRSLIAEGLQLAQETSYETH